MADPVSAERQLDEITAAVRSLAEVMRENGLTKVDIELGNVSIKLSAGNTRDVAPAASVPAILAIPTSTATLSESVGYLIAAPMIGTFYLTAGPGEPPFVRVGDRVEAGQTIGIIEAMKIMNEIPADRGGVVTEILVANSQPVEYGSPLLRLGFEESSG
jgi:acetyl-CoA carboxylase biotin carboxyl carrier protein